MPHVVAVRRSCEQVGSTVSVNHVFADVIHFTEYNYRKLYGNIFQYVAITVKQTISECVGQESNFKNWLLSV